MCARFTVLSDAPIAAAIAGCVIPLSRNSTIWMRWRCAAGIFHRSAVFSRCTSALLHSAICFPRIRWCKRITPWQRKTASQPAAALTYDKSRFKPLWRWYKIDISDDGTVKVASANGDAMKAAINWIKSIASEPEVGHIYDGTVVKVMDFGAFVNFFGAKDGLVHISQLAPRRVQKVTDVVKEGDKVKVKLLGFDERGKVRLSMKVVDQATGEDLEAKQKAEAEQQRTDQQREAAGAE